MPKSELVASLLNNDDEVEVVIIKAKPKYPNQIFQNKQALPTAAKPPTTKPELQTVVEPIKESLAADIEEVIVEEDR
jgi:hypothetical protein